MKKFVKIMVVIAIWFFIWTVGHLLYYFNFINRYFPYLKSLASIKYFLFAGWLILAGVVIFWVWQLKNLSLFFLSLKNKAWLSFYLIPLGQLIYWFFQKDTPFGLVGWQYGLLILITTMTQDLFTFGFLQTLLEKLWKPWPAALLTVLIFFLGHFYFQISFLTLIFIIGFFSFAFLRLKYRSIYAINIIHLIFSLLPIQF